MEIICDFASAQRSHDVRVLIPIGFVVKNYYTYYYIICIATSDGANTGGVGDYPSRYTLEERYKVVRYF